MAMLTWSTTQTRVLLTPTWSTGVCDGRPTNWKGPRRFVFVGPPPAALLGGYSPPPFTGDREFGKRSLSRFCPGVQPQTQASQTVRFAYRERVTYSRLQHGMWALSRWWEAAQRSLVRHYAKITPSWCAASKACVGWIVSVVQQVLDANPRLLLDIGCGSSHPDVGLRPCVDIYRFL